MKAENTTKIQFDSLKVIHTGRKRLRAERNKI